MTTDDCVVQSLWGYFKDDVSLFEEEEEDSQGFIVSFFYIFLVLSEEVITEIFPYHIFIKILKAITGIRTYVFFSSRFFFFFVFFLVPELQFQFSIKFVIFGNMPVTFFRFRFRTFIILSIMLRYEP